MGDLDRGQQRHSAPAGTVTAPGEQASGQPAKEDSLPAADASQGGGGMPPMLAVPTVYPQGQEKVLCILCLCPSAGLFQHALNLCTDCGADDVEERDRVEDFAVELRQHGERWALPTLVAAVTGGRHIGLTAVGVGTNYRSRKRASRLGLALMAWALTPVVTPPDRTGDGAFARVVWKVCELFGLPRPQPSLPSSGSDRGSTQGSSRMASWELPWPPPCPPAPGGTQPPPPQPEEGSPSKTGATPLWQPKEPEDLLDREVLATAGYQAEMGGYLSLQQGDRLRLRWQSSEPGEDTDQFCQYLFGERVSGPSCGQGDEDVGWFPMALVRLVDAF